MILALLVILFLLAVAGGFAVHPLLFVLALFAVILLVVGSRGGRVP